MVIDTLKSFWEKVERRGPDDCWLWTGAATIRGYGQLASGATKRRTSVRCLATHVALAIDGRFKPSEEHVAMHLCDNPRCVNPTHLQWGTFQENTADCRRKGRLAPQIIARVRAEQEANHWSKGKSRRLLSPEAVHLIRNSKRKTSYLAKRMGVAEQTIRHIRAGRTYKDV